MEAPAAHPHAPAPAAIVPSRPNAHFHALTAAWALLALIMCASLGRFMITGVVVLFGAVLTASWCHELVRALFDREARGRLTRGALGAWAIFPLTVLLFAALSFSPWPYVMRVKLSEHALLRLVEDVEASRASPGRAGLIFVDDARAVKGCVVLTTESGYLTEYGLVFSQAGTMPKPPALHLRHLYGPWYVFHHDPF